MRLTPLMASQILAAITPDIGEAPEDFDQLQPWQIGVLLEYADTHGYRKPRSANGSRARYFYNFVQRRARVLP